MATCRNHEAVTPHLGDIADESPQAAVACAK